MNKNHYKILLLLIVTLLTSLLLFNCQPIESNPEKELPTADEILAMAEEHFAGIELPESESGGTRTITDSDYIGMYYPFNTNGWRLDVEKVELKVEYHYPNYFYNRVNFYDDRSKINETFLTNGLKLEKWYELDYDYVINGIYHYYHIIFLPYQTSSGNVYQLCVVRYEWHTYPLNGGVEYYYYLNF